MGWIVATAIVVFATAALIIPLAIPSYRRTAYGRFMLRQAVWLPRCLVFISVLMMIIAGLYEIPRVRWRSLEPAFAGHIDEYLLIQPHTVMRIPEMPRPRISGLIVVDRTDSKIATAVCSELPPSLRANTPQAVKTIVWLEWKEVDRGRGSSGGLAPRVDCDVTVIENTSGILLYRKTIRGDEPRGPKPRSESGSGARPYDQIIAYLRSLAVSRAPFF